jgi:transcriptional regulator with XRE-family HTH domain
MLLPPARRETPLKRILEDEGRKQAWLARRLGVTRGTVGAWANGIRVPAPEVRARVAELLGREVAEVWEQDEPPVAASAA